MTYLKGQCNLNGVSNGIRNQDSNDDDTLTKVCDKNTGQCYCNEMSEGRNCDLCKQVENVIPIFVFKIA